METKISFVWTIVLGLFIGVGANILTPYIRKLMGRVSTSARYRNETKKRAFDASVKYLIENPVDEVNLRSEANTRLLVSLLLTVLTGLVTLSDRTLMGLIVAVLCSVATIYFFIRFAKLSKLTRAAWLERRKNHPEVDLD